MTENQLYQRLASEVRRPIIRWWHVTISLALCVGTVVAATAWIEKVLP